MRQLVLLVLFTLGLGLHPKAQQYSISGKIADSKTGIGILGCTICLDSLNHCTSTDDKGFFKLKGVYAGKYTITISSTGYDVAQKDILITTKNIRTDVSLNAHVSVLDSVQVRGSGKTFGITRLREVEDGGIYAGKKNEVIVLKDITANTATNNTRQIYSRIEGLNIYENDGGAGVQLAIGGRGLNPNRVSNFNTRQNGYDISADALGYPESYYTPPAEVLSKIEIVRGAASLEYGTQFGGIINFKMNSGPDSSKFLLDSRLTAGSWGFLNTATSIGGTVNKLNYYVFYQHKSGDGWRPNSSFNVNTAYVAATLHASSRISVSFQYTHMDYIEQQPGGLNDAMFAADARQSTKSRNWFKVNWNLGAVLFDYPVSKNLLLNSRFFGLLGQRSALGIINTVTDPGPGWPRNYRTDEYTNWGNETRFIYTYNRHNGKPFVFLAGARYYHGYTDREVGYGNGDAGGAKSDFSFDKSTEYDSLSYSHYTFPNHNLAFFAENIFRFGPRLSIIPGIRFESIYTKSDGFYNNPQQDLASVYTGTVISNSLITEHRVNRRSFILGGIGFSYDQNSWIQLYGNISQNYRGINFNDMSIVNPNIRVDPNLKDEQGYSADIGARGHVSNIFTYDISVFTIDYADRIGTVWLRDTSSIIYQYTTNISKSRNIGIESFAELDIWKLLYGRNAKMKLSVFSNLSFISARYVNSKEPAYENKKVEFVPPVIFKTGINFQKGKISGTYQYSFTARQFGDATNATTPSNNGINGLVPAYSAMDVSIDYRLNKKFSFSGTVNNLSNSKYFTRRADSYPGPGIIPADPISFYITAEVKL